MPNPIEIAAEFLDGEVKSWRLHEPSQADGMCVCVSAMFLAFVKERWPGLDSAYVEVLGCAEDPYFWHCIARVGDVYYDFTLRQIRTQSPFPWTSSCLDGWAKFREVPYTGEDLTNGPDKFILHDDCHAELVGLAAAFTGIL